MSIKLLRDFDAQGRPLRHYGSLEAGLLPDSGLVLWLTRDDGPVAATGTLPDRSLADNDATLVGNAVVGSDGLQLDGTGDYATIADDASLDFDSTDSVTIMGWVRQTATGTDVWGVLLNKMETSGNYRGWYVNTARATNYANPGVPYAYLMTETGAHYRITQGTTRLDDGNWHHIAAVYSGDGVGFSLVVDGAAEGSVVGSAGTLGAMSNAVVATVGANGLHTTCHPGSLDDIRFYRRALSVANILAIYNLTKWEHGYEE